MQGASHKFSARGNFWRFNTYVLTITFLPLSNSFTSIELWYDESLQWEDLCNQYKTRSACTLLTKYSSILLNYVLIRLKITNKNRQKIVGWGWKLLTLDKIVCKMSAKNRLIIVGSGLKVWKKRLKIVCSDIKFWQRKRLNIVSRKGWNL